MREVTFRGRRTDNGAWAYGFYNEFANPGTGEQESYIQTVKRDGRIDFIRKVKPETVGQYAGVNDIHGNKVFEHDLVGYMWELEKIIMKIVFEDGEFLMQPVGKYHFETWPLRVSGMEMEVVGNVFDNPDMMEE